MTIPFPPLLELVFFDLFPFPLSSARHIVTSFDLVIRIIQQLGLVSSGVGA